MNSTPSIRINDISCAEMKQAGPRSEKDVKQIRQVRNNNLVPFHKERHDFPVGHNYEQILACQSGHTFYFCNADSIWLRRLDSTATGFRDISINLAGPEASMENPQDNTTAFPPWSWYPQAVLENVRLSADVYCCSSLVSSRDCSRGFELIYGDKTSPISVTAAVPETSPSTDATTDAPTDMTTMLTSPPPPMTSPQTSEILVPTTQQSIYNWIAWATVIGGVVIIGCVVYCKCCRRPGHINTLSLRARYIPALKSKPN
ncbi:hypothetical protein BV898_18969 [Hypsibius exemplaris]|uniref:Uncharacterized protein n=1 Tax=Hypsibius exemplaris TaxID=2072580 RepID=A0A9X6NJS5_HYPEX|nr:hypothetical protein BV898_18969 [Hypsibius exemplaris]